MNVKTIVKKLQPVFLATGLLFGTQILAEDCPTGVGGADGHAVEPGDSGGMAPLPDPVTSLGPELWEYLHDPEIHSPDDLSNYVGTYAHVGSSN
jgi:hypothetical protein